MSYSAALSEVYSLFSCLFRNKDVVSKDGVKTIFLLLLCKKKILDLSQKLLLKLLAYIFTVFIDEGLDRG